MAMMDAAVREYMIYGIDMGVINNGRPSQLTLGRPADLF
jgi:hypothetical protein